MKRLKKFITAILVLAVVAGIGYWFAVRQGWLNTYGPDNLPTAEERERIKAIEESSSTIAPNAKAGAGVVPKGSKPVAPPPTPTPASTSTPEGGGSTATTTEE